ncbi:MAG: endolytic transglycosylase MltG [Acidobacteria bacterium]|nr:endolytic transglycosylase MltG [Acidobacteriota bacterium]
MKRILLVAAALFVVALLGVAAWAVNGMAPPDAQFAAPVVVDIPRGASSRDMAALLEEPGVIRSATHFMLARAWRSKDVLQAGEYEFTRPVSVWDAFDKLASGAVLLHTVTVPEGLTRFEIAKLVQEAGFGSADAFLTLTADPGPIRDLFPAAQSLEGCLYPETYSFPRNTEPKTVLDAMLRGFRNAFEQAKQGSDSKLAPYEALTMASLIEKETGVDDERPLVSSVYYNRIRIGMLLQCDPTIIYGLLLEDRYRGKIYESDIRDPHDYNTYVHAGLPPGPIANPGLASLKAAFHPADTNYLYFVAESAGKPGHIFSKNLQAHNQAVAQYRRTLR